jgi:hypothetical protein
MLSHVVLCSVYRGVLLHVISRCSMYSLYRFAAPCYLTLFYVQSIDLFILKNMGAAIIDFRVCPPLVKCQNIMFSGFIDTLMYGFSSTGVTIYCRVISAWNSMITPAVKWFINGDIITMIWQQLNYLVCIFF